MNRIVRKKQLSADVFEFEFEAPEIARERKAGQFLVVLAGGEYGERIPLTIAPSSCRPSAPPR